MKRWERVFTVATCVAVAVLIVAFLASAVVRNSGGMTSEDFLRACMVLTSILTFVVLAFGVVMMRSSESNTDRFEEYARKRKQEESEDGKRRPPVRCRSILYCR